MLRRLSILAAAITALLLLVVAPAASAHTQMTDTIPADGAVLDASPPQVIVVFNDAIQADRSSVVVLDASGATVAEGGLDPADPTHLVADLPPLANGQYIVRWTAYSADDELIRDQFGFEVAAAATPAPTPTPTPTPTAEPSAEPTATTAPVSPEPTSEVKPVPSAAPDGDTSGGTDVIQVIIPLVIGGVIVAAVAVYLIRRRQP